MQSYLNNQIKKDDLNREIILFNKLLFEMEIESFRSIPRDQNFRLFILENESFSNHP